MRLTQGVNRRRNILRLRSFNSKKTAENFLYHISRENVISEEGVLEGEMREDTFEDEAVRSSYVTRKSMLFLRT